MFGKEPPFLASFGKPLDSTMAAQYQGKIADLFFFTNKGNVAHKWLHYLPIYDQVIGPYAGSKVRMLEMGVNTGGSLDIWRKLLGLDAVIFGIDIDTKCASLNGQSGEVRIGSQDDPTFLQSVVREMGGSILSWTMVPILPRTSEPALTRCSPPF